MVVEGGVSRGSTGTTHYWSISRDPPHSYKPVQEGTIYLLRYREDHAPLASEAHVKAHTWVTGQLFILGAGITVPSNQRQ